MTQLWHFLMERKRWWWGASIKTKGLWVWTLIIPSAPHYGDERDSQKWRVGSHILSLVGQPFSHLPLLSSPLHSHPLTRLFCTDYLVLSFKIFMCLCVHLHVMCVGASEGRKKCWSPLSWSYRKFWGRAASTLNWWAASLAPWDTMMGAGPGGRGEDGTVKEWAHSNEAVPAAV